MALAPLLAASLTGNLHVAAASVGAAVGIGLIGAKACEAVGRNPSSASRVLTQSVLAMALVEGVVFFAIFLAGFAG